MKPGVESRVSSFVPTDQLLDLAIQIAGGLDAAHLKGMVHRNIYRTPIP